MAVSVLERHLEAVDLDEGEQAEIKSIQDRDPPGLTAAPGYPGVSRGQELWLVHQLRPYLPKLELAMVVHAMVTSRLDYCNTLYMGLPLKTI